jgi:DNA-binding CsgD family transcriptional regulator/tetratricopeptide (TPR) repeat protein
VVDPVAELEQGRRSYAAQAWGEAHRRLSDAARAAPLAAEDLERLATAAYMLNRDDEYLGALERAHLAHLDDGRAARAARCAFWLGLGLAGGGEYARAAGWFARAQRVLEREGRECVERGYLLIPVVLRHVAAGEPDAAYAAAAEAVAIGERFRDADLVAMARHEQGHALIRRGRAAEGLGLVDEAMVAVTAGELSPIVTGLVYCNVIAFCQEVHEVRRAREWTAALTRWCERQPDMVAHTGRCLVHRAEIMQLDGAWPDALEEARRAAFRLTQDANEVTAGQAWYRQGEVHRLRGEFAAAERTYREASRCGWEPQPGLALLRLAQGRVGAAEAAIRRVVDEATEPLARGSVLPAYVEILLALGETGQARSACLELEARSRGQEGGVLGALVAQARGAVTLAEGDARAALVLLRRAAQVWRELKAPYEGARVRVLVGLACRALGDHDTAALELEAACAVFAELGAGPDLADVEALTGPATDLDAHGLTPRELQVLRLVAEGKSNREIASALVISEHTVARHLQNIFAKLRVSSRTAASAFAFVHDLV